MRALVLLALFVLAGAAACTHDWERYDVVEDGSAGGGSSGGSSGIGGAASADACLEVCDALDDCGTPVPDCSETCAGAIVACPDAEDIERVSDCAKSYRALCNLELYETCLPACY